MEFSRFGFVRNANRDRRFTQFMAGMIFFVRLLIGQFFADPEKTSAAMSEAGDGSQNLETK